MNHSIKASIVATGCLFALNALGLDYPSRPIRFIVPNAPGGGTDITARAIGQKLTETWGQTIVVDNRAGGTGTIGLDIAAKSPGDGYTIVLVTGTHTARRATHRKLPYDLLRDFAPISQMTSQSYVLVVNPSVPAKSVKELVSIAQGSPTGFTFGSSGLGSLQHLSGALLGTATKSNLVHVPYKGGGPALADVLAGHINMVFATPLEARPHIKTGRVRALAVTGAKRSIALPDLPTVAEFGVEGYEVTNWYGVLAPAATPVAVLTRLNRGIVETLRSSDMIDRFKRDGVEPMGTTIEQFGAHIRAEIVKWERVVAAAGIQAE